MNSRIRSLWARKAVAVILSLCLVSPFSTALAAGEGKDIQGHWAEKKQLKAWIDKGYIQAMPMERSNRIIPLPGLNL